MYSLSDAASRNDWTVLVYAEDGFLLSAMFRMSALDALVHVLATALASVVSAAGTLGLSGRVELASASGLRQGPRVDSLLSWFRNAALAGVSALDALVSVAARALGASLVAAGAVGTSRVEVAAAAGCVACPGVIGENSQESWIVGISDAEQFNSHAEEAVSVVLDKVEADILRSDWVAIVAVQAVVLPCRLIRVTNECPWCLRLQVEHWCPCFAVRADVNRVLCDTPLLSLVSLRANSVDVHYLTKVDNDPWFLVVRAWYPASL